MIRYKLIASLLLFCNIIWAQSMRTLALSPDIETIEVNVNGNWNRSPIIKLNSFESIHIGFDRLSDDSFNRLRYKVVHCDADWKPTTTISEIDYLDGFNDNLINNYAPSINTTVEYTHFNLDIPNADVSLKISGNYIVQVYEEDYPDNILLNAGFSVLDSQLNVGATVSSNTDIDSNKEHQQVSFSIHHAGLSIRDPLNDLKVYVRQNNRLDSERTNLKPTFIGSNKITYEHNRNLIFEAGNEYHRFETGSYRYNGMNVEHIEYHRPYYSMYITKDQVKANGAYHYDQDQNGRFIIRNSESDYTDTEADYFLHHFSLAMNNPLLENIYINGDFTRNTFSDRYKMIYDYNSREYHLSLLLKQGLYNYQYLSKEGKQYSTQAVEGNYFETENEYCILVYYRPIGQRYDSLIGMITVQSRNK